MPWVQFKVKVTPKFLPVIFALSNSTVHCMMLKILMYDTPPQILFYRSPAGNLYL